MNLICWHHRTLLQAAKTLQFASLSFDASFHEMFAAWSSGGAVYFITEELRRNVGALAHYISVQGIQKVILPVVVLQQLAEQLADKPQVLQSLRELATHYGSGRCASEAATKLCGPQSLRSIRDTCRYGPDLNGRQRAVAIASFRW
jgi:hypothetical protein